MRRLFLLYGQAKSFDFFLASS